MRIGLCKCSLSFVRLEREVLVVEWEAFAGT
jgi:hypothetical protein